MNSTPDKDFLEYVVKALVDHPEDVKIDRKIDERGVLLTLRVNPMDMGQVVGRKGATAKAIRSLLRIVGIKNNAYVNLKIEEPQGEKPAFVLDKENPAHQEAYNRNVGEIMAYKNVGGIPSRGSLAGHPHSSPSQSSDSKVANKDFPKRS